MQTLVSVVTTLATYDLKVVFAVDIALSHTLESHPRRHGTIGLLQSFIHRRGPGSLHAYLKKKGWIAGLSTDTDGPTLSFDTMSVQIRLTEAGFSEWSQYPATGADVLTRKWQITTRML